MLARFLLRLWNVGRETWEAYSRNLGPQLAASISYRVLFSLFPLAIFLVSVFGLLIQNDERRDDIVRWLVDNLFLSPEGSVRLDQAVEGLDDPPSALGLVALVGVLWGVSGMMSAIRVALTNVWGAERRVAWRGKALDFVLVLLAGLLLLVAFAFTLVVRVVEDLGSRVGAALGLEALGPAAGDLAQAAGSLGALFGAILLLYRYLPIAGPPFRRIWAPALVTALAIQATETGYGFYLSRFADYNLVYGSLGAVIGFLFLVYLCAAIFLFGAQLAAVWRRASTAAGRR
jgi:membrane protein